MRKMVKAARLVLVGSALLLMLSGMVVWRGQGDQPTQLSALHALLGLALVASLWVIAALAARGGVSLRVVALAVSWSLVAVTVGVAQKELLGGSRHWTIEVLHLVTAMGIVAWGQGLVLLVRRAGTRRQRPAT